MQKVTFLRSGFMKQMLKGYMSLIALFSACAFVSTSTALPRIMVRSQSVDSARELVGWAHQVNLFDVGCLYGTFAITPEYTQSFRSNRLAQNVFGNIFNSTTGTSCTTGCFDNSCDNNDCGLSFNVTGSCVANRGSCDLLADYFGLPTDFNSTITVKPRISNFLVDFDLYLGLDEWLCGLWFRVHAPVVHAKWKLGLCETVNAAGTNAHPAGYFSNVEIPRANLLTNFAQFLSGAQPNFAGVAGNNVTFNPLNRQLVPNCTVNSSCNTSCNSSCDNDGQSLKDTKLSEIQMALGWNFWQCDDYHVGLGVRVAAPTGTRIGKCPYLFSPIIGNGHHWELGAMFTSHYTFWRGCDYDRSFGLYVDMNITHLFNTRQCRTFDLCGRGTLSSYMLAQQLTDNVTTLNGNTTGVTAGGAVPATGYTASNAQFANVFTPVANLTTANVKVSIPVQVDLTAMFNYQHCGFEWDLGYNLWATSCEKIKGCARNCTTGSTTNNLVTANYALKGDSYVYGQYLANAITSPTGFTAQPLAATQSLATIHTGRNGCPETTANLGNPGIDNRQFAYVGTGAAAIPVYTFAAVPVNVAANPQERTSIQPVTLVDNNLDINGARAKGLTHKVFTHFSYTWECDCWMPYVGIGGKAEFAQGRNNDCCTTDCITSPSLSSTVCNTNTNCGSSTNCSNGNCARTSISEWGIWIKGGVAFN